MTSWNWVYLSDFAGYKPTFLPEVRLRFPDLRTKFSDMHILTDQFAIVLIKRTTPQTFLSSLTLPLGGHVIWHQKDSINQE